MKITVENGRKITVFNNVSDYYIAVRVHDPLTEGSAMITGAHTYSQSYGAALREIVKEVQQSLVELQDHLRKVRNGGDPS
jgi:hypothetical protein